MIKGYFLIIENCYLSLLVIEKKKHGDWGLVSLFLERKSDKSE